MKTNFLILQTHEDILADALKDAEQENPCDCSEDSQVEAEYVSNRYFRGIKVTCLTCGTITAELDDPE